MNSDKKFNMPPKRNFPTFFLLLLFGAVLSVLAVQSFVLGQKKAGVSFSHQLEHLVNLELVIPEETFKVALNDHLVTFGGRFKDKESENTLNKFKYLEFLNAYHHLQSDELESIEAIRIAENSVKQSVLYFFDVTGIPITADGFKIVQGPALGNAEESLKIVSRGNTRSGISLTVLEAQCKNLRAKGSSALAQDWEALCIHLNQLLAKYKSPSLGIGSESLKQQLVRMSQSIDKVDLAKEELEANCLNVLKDLKQLTDNLMRYQGGVSFNELRAVRQYKEAHEHYVEVLKSLEYTEAGLEKARRHVANSVWFFNNKELSSKALERQDPEIFSHWFDSAQDEWVRFKFNKSLTFKAPDQPRNLVLEKIFKSEEPSPNYLSYLFTVFPVLVVLFLVYFVFARQIKGVGGSAMSFGKSPAKLLQKGQHKVTFKDVAGVEEAKEELVEIVDFLKNPQKFTILGGRIPKGVLLIGPPGTGKTLVAKAVAGEAERPFFSIAGSDFVEMFVGVGASRIRDMFEQAKKSAPCIIFIDEIDAVGRHRGAGMGGGHDEREQTLNQLLVEMDGFDTNEGVILMAATNRPDVLDKALLRPGRFDRRVVIELPDIKGRFEILTVHAKKIKLDEEVDLMSVARGSPGSSGADLENLLNEAALLAARRERKTVTMSEVRIARDKVLYGKERKSLEMDAQEKNSTAYHESGHAVVGLTVKKSDPVDKVTIIPRGLSLGATHFLPQKNRLSYWREELLDKLAVLMGGKAAEEIFLKDTSSGAQQDILQATRIARSMVCQWGMSESLGVVAYDDNSENSNSYGSRHTETTYSEETAKAIDVEVKSILTNAYSMAKDIVTAKSKEIELMTAMLIEFETLEAQDVMEIMDGSWSMQKKRDRMLAQDHKVDQNTPPPFPTADIDPV
ncbi:ATP-dependent zinc metalloprotease FtsH [Candidatus Clavichlamydia salmonicola]|uniref:ATP-dependent zinc metalloprotease FtsH n=1 Tax=Candidatus Clavichlamydia salmonicola TaxID=469812 RepID=UPI0018911DF4|nr:ATP-dependent zinc metalloprotease FtsH [Candidatus Clavichlamydia salmonicola]